MDVHIPKPAAEPALPADWLRQLKTLVAALPDEPSPPVIAPAAAAVIENGAILTLRGGTEARALEVVARVATDLLENWNAGFIFGWALDLSWMQSRLYVGNLTPEEIVELLGMVCRVVPGVFEGEPVFASQEDRENLLAAVERVAAMCGAFVTHRHKTLSRVTGAR